MGYSDYLFPILAYSLSLPFVLWKLRQLEKKRSPSQGERQNLKMSATFGDEKVLLTIELTPKLSEILHHIEEVTSDPLDEILVKAISLYRFSVDAHKEGKRIGVLDRDSELEREVVGFEHQRSS